MPGYGSVVCAEAFQPQVHMVGGCPACNRPFPGRLGAELTLQVLLSEDGEQVLGSSCPGASLEPQEGMEEHQLLS